MSSFLQFRTVWDHQFSFCDKYPPIEYDIPEPRFAVKTSEDLLAALKAQMDEICQGGRAALALSGGIDSAILAKLMPKGSTAYTFKCVVPGVDVTDESPRAARYAEACGLNHTIVEVYWEDVIEMLPSLMRRKGMPIHSIEIQILKAALMAKNDGFGKLIFGESADCLYGGLSNVLSRDWTMSEFVERYSYIMPDKVLRDPQLILDPFVAYEQDDGYIDVHRFYSEFFFKESTASYMNACSEAGVELVMPYAHTRMLNPLDYERVRRGENKYLVREVFNALYEGFDIPPKTPMPRPTSEWFSDWEGPKRNEFLPNCVAGLSGDQKWLVFCLESFLNMIE